jgi:hypothetical protein
VSYILTCEVTAVDPLGLKLNINILHICFQVNVSQFKEMDQSKTVDQSNTVYQSKSMDQSMNVEQSKNVDQCTNTDFFCQVICFWVSAGSVVVRLSPNFLTIRADWEVSCLEGGREEKLYIWLN